MKSKKIISALILSGLLIGCNNGLKSNDSNKTDSSSGIQISKETTVDKSQLMLPNFTTLVKKVGNTVVNITADSTRQVNNMFDGPEMGGENDPFFEFFKHFAPQAPQQQQIRRSMGSGFIISPDGYILTNAHVVTGTSKIVVKIMDKRQFIAKLVGIDPKTDIALLKVNATNLPTVVIGDSNKLQVGEWVAAIGAPFGFDNSVTQGIVSAIGRNLPNDSLVPFIQTDVPINPGNSGGPLFNLNGEVVGINSQIYSRSGGYMGISFSIPIDIAINIAQQLQQYGKAEHGQLGVQIQPVTQDLAKSFGLSSTYGAIVAQVVPESGAAKAGIKPGDVILKVDGTNVNDAQQLPLLIGNRKPGTVVVLSVFRDKVVKDITVTLTSATPPQPLATRDDSQNNNQKSDSVTIDKFGLTISTLTTDIARQLGLNFTKGGVLVSQATGVSQMAGISSGDVILTINNQPVNNINQVKKLIGNSKVITLLVSRGGQQIFVSLSVD